MKRSDYFKILLIVIILLALYSFLFYCLYRVRVNLTPDEIVYKELIIIDAQESLSVTLSDSVTYWTFHTSDNWIIGDTVIATFIDKYIQTIKPKENEQ